MIKELNLSQYAKKYDLEEILIYRPIAKKIYEDVIHDISLLSSETILKCSFQNVEMCDVSFSDGFIINLQKYVMNCEKAMMIITDANETVQENLEAALSLRNKQDHSKICLLFYQNNDYRIIGDLEKNLKESFELVKNLKELTARELAHRFNIEINSASNRLKKLFNLRLLLRQELIDESGRQHLYYIPSIK